MKNDWALKSYLEMKFVFVRVGNWKITVNLLAKMFLCHFSY